MFCWHLFHFSSNWANRFLQNIHRRKLQEPVHLSNAYVGFRIMKSKDLQKIVLSKCQIGDAPTDNHCDLNGGIGLRAIKPWHRMICQSGSVALSTLPACPSFVRTKEQYSKSQIPFMPKRNEYQLENYRCSLAFLTEVSGE